MNDNVDTHDNPARHRYEITVDDQLAGFAVYYAEGQSIAFIHTEIAPEYEGRGLGSTLARHSLDDIRSRGLGVLPLCPFYARFIGKHPEYQDLVRAGAHQRIVLGGHDG
ncbi:GNAT family N-acetyltransferase [Micromonospora sp. WMMC250]|uniref:GNAT family N-acetyltransferase n=1 Tax=Micromonospora sp. WMMC250 TaxID=3014781 RepID=UPI0022B6037A|nr:GNAT family N-acetyltransferase [Micromonospora sp. WMMC250]MCZ7375906.1 GNAT family N-acetyltransferase [Micromonospora sp. WMMC250]